MGLKQAVRMVRAPLRQHTNEARISNRPTTFDTAKLKTTALQHLGLDLQIRFA